MKLKPKDWVDPPPQAPDVVDKKTVKDAIKAFVDKPKEYKDIIKYIQVGLISQNKHIKDSEILKYIKEVKEEWHPPVEE